MGRAQNTCVRPHSGPTRPKAGVFYGAGCWRPAVTSVRQ
jgi:hypothetical protein